MKKNALIVLPIIALLLILIFKILEARFTNSNFQNTQYGITFSQIYAQSLGLDYTDTFSQILTELKVKKIRIPVYWKRVESEEGKFDFSDTDKLLDLTDKHQTEVILAIGYKVPRWPECSIPNWVQGLKGEELNQKILNMVSQTVDHFKGRSSVVAWQVENEPQLDFGNCRIPTTEFLKKEVEQVRSKDVRPIFMTDSGELESWATATKLADKTGVSIYRYGWDPYLGFHSYPIPPFFYPLKAAVTEKVLGISNHPVYVSELQTEPWPAGTSIPQTPIEEQLKIFPLKQIRDNLDYAQKTGLTPYYLWGAEWWYYMKAHNHPEYWEFARTLFK